MKIFILEKPESSRYFDKFLNPNLKCLLIAKLLSNKHVLAFIHITQLAVAALLGLVIIRSGMSVFSSFSSRLII